MLCPWLLAAAVTACAPHSAPITANALTTAGQVGAPRPTSVANTAAATAATSAPAVAPDSAWWSTDDVRVPRYAGVVRASRHIAMDDGVRLAIDVYLPRNLEPGTRLPTILEQTRYRRSLEPRPELRDSLDRPGSRTAAFVTRGYAYVVVDVRGSGASFGSRNIELGPIEVGDGNEVVDWIIRQPWSNGAVGATGISYVGSTAELLLVNRHPAVRAIVPQFSYFDAYTDIAVPAGIPSTWFTTTWARTIAAMDRDELSEAARRSFVGTRPADGDSGAVLLTQAIRDHAANQDIHENIRGIVFRDDTALAGWTLDQISPHAKLDDIRASGAAIYSYSGWYDGAYARAAALRFRAVRTPGSRLVLGPWNHGGGAYYSPSLGTLPSSFPHTRELLRFYRVDTTASTGTRSRWNTLVGGGPVVYPDRKTEDGRLLTYTSAPLAQDMEVTGHPIVTLFVNSTASDGAFFVYLEEVDESGHVRYVTEGALRAIHRKRSDDPPAYATIIPHRTYRRGDAMPLVPGQIAELTFDLLPTSYLFREGRRIRVAIAGADIDHFPAIPAIPPTVHVLRDREHPSRIHLPVIP